MDTWPFQHLRRGSINYEKARRQAVWNGRVPEQYPELIAYPENSEHVREVVLFAKEKGMSIGTKSGGHSWTASFLRDGGILLDLAKMNHFTVDTANRTATAQPATYGSDLNLYLVPHNLMFPAGHCPTVGLGGYLLQGGFGWNSRKWGLGCENVLAIEVVNAEGELIRANSTDYPEYYWAARGAGCGYFGIVTQFTLRLWPLPQSIMTSRYVFSMDDFEEVTTAVDDACQRYPRDLEVSGFVARDQDGFSETTIAITGDAMSETREEALHGLEMLHNLPIVRKCLKSEPFVACTLKDLLKRFEDILDNRERRYEANNIWTDTPVVDMNSRLRLICESMPPAPSHMYLVWWSPQGRRPDMAFSMEANLYIALYGIGTDPNHDAKHAHYVVSSMKMMDDHRKGIQLADENLPAHPGKFMKVQNYRKLESLRRKYDPERRFFSYIRVPEEFEGLLML